MPLSPRIGLGTPWQTVTLWAQLIDAHELQRVSGPRSQPRVRGTGSKGACDRTTRADHGGVMGYLDTTGPGCTRRAATLADVLCDGGQRRFCHSCPSRQWRPPRFRLARILVAPW